MSSTRARRGAVASLLAAGLILTACNSAVSGTPVAAETGPLTSSSPTTTTPSPTSTTPSSDQSTTTSSPVPSPTTSDSTTSDSTTSTSTTPSTTSSSSTIAAPGSPSPMLADKMSVVRPKVPDSGPVTVAVSALPKTLDVNSYQAIGYISDVSALTLPSPYLVDPYGNIAMDGDLMAEVTVKNAPQTVIYRINPQATWSDGTAVSCQDFYLAWLAQRSKAADPKDEDSLAFHTYWSGVYDNAKAPQCSDGGSTVTVEFTSPDASWPEMFQGLLPAHVAAQDAGVSDITSIDASDKSGAVLKLADAFNKDFGKIDPSTAVSAGPYVVTEAGPDSIKLERNPKWWGNPAGPSAITLDQVPDPASELQSVENGNVDVASLDTQDPKLGSQVHEMSNVTRTNQLWPINEHVEFNLHKKLFTGKAGKALRQAVFGCIDRSAIVGNVAQQINPDADVLGNMFVEPWNSGYQDHYGDQFDPAKAKMLMQQGGWTMKGDVFQHKGTKASFVLSYLANTSRVQIGQIIAQQCQAVGISITAKQLDAAKLYSGDFQAALFGWSTPIMPADFDFTYASDASNNTSGYSNPKVDQLLNDMAKDINPTDETDRLNKIDKMIAEDHVTLPLYAWSVINLQSDDIHTTVTNNYYWGGVVWDAYAWTVTG